MSGSGRFCPRCGEAIPEDGGMSPPDTSGSARAEICRSCYVEAIDLVDVPETLTVHLCTICGAVRKDDTWADVEHEDYTDVVVDVVADDVRIHRDATDVSWTVTPRQRGPNELDVHVDVSAAVDDHPIGEQHAVEVRLSRETCPPCGRRAGDYYAGTVQVRATGRRPDPVETDRAVEIAREIVDGSDDRASFVSKVVDRPEGVDVRVSTNGLADQIADRITAELGGTVDSSETLVTEDEDGEGVYRVAFAVRLPRFRPGDIVRTDDDAPILIEGDVNGRRLDTGEPVTVDDGTTGEVIGAAADATETTLVAVEDGNAIQVLDPETAAAVTIPRPDDLETEGETVHVVRIDTTVYPIPETILDRVGS